MSSSKMLVLVCALLPATVTLAAQGGGEVRALRQQIAALQLDHTLDLTRQQAQALLPLLQSAQAKVKAARDQRAASAPALTAALTQAVADLKSTGAISSSTAQAVQAARGGAAGTLRQDLRAFWQQARQILTADQLHALRSTRLGVGPAMASDSSDHSTQGRGPHAFGERFRALHALLSDAFVSLVQARAS
jgi:hypothetical protein